MAVQILGLREYRDKSGNTRIAERLFEKGWRSPSVKELFANMEEIIAQIPQEERYNLYYTASECVEASGRNIEKQDILPFDIDGIDVDRYEEYIPVILNVLQRKRDEVGIVMSGNGLQIIVGITEIIDYAEWFEDNRALYKALCGAINQTLYKVGLSGGADTAVFSSARLLRLPFTENRKKKKGVKQAILLENNIVHSPFDLKLLSGIPDIAETDQIHVSVLNRLPTADAVGVQAGCDFLKHCLANQEDMSEPEWYAMLSIIGRVEDGRRLAHVYSNQHPDYHAGITDTKLEQSMNASGPRTCNNIATMYDGCIKCPHWGVINSPITLKSSTYIKTRGCGFHSVGMDANGDPKVGKPNYDDLMLYFKEKHPFCTLENANIVYTFDSKKWADKSHQRIFAFAEDNFDPKPVNAMCKEFHGKLTRNEIVPATFFEVEGKINFNNGVLDLETEKLEAHDATLGFKYVLPFDYDPQALCPRFDKFLEEITLSDRGLEDVLLEFMGYSIAGIDASLGQKALILTGDGSNGKSVYLDVLKELAGEGNYSTLSMGNEINKLENRYQLDGKLFNVSEETPAGAMMDSSIFKALVTGGEVQSRKLYHDAYSMRNKAKIIMACNELPETIDLTHGMFRRLLIVPFNAKFSGKNMDIHIRKKLYAEASGIYNRVLKALSNFQKNEGFTVSETVEAEVSGYKSYNDNVSQWWADNMIQAQPTVEVSSNALYQSYRIEAEGHGVKPMKFLTFSKRIRECSGGLETQRKKVDGKYHTMIRGWALGTGTEGNF